MKKFAIGAAVSLFGVSAALAVLAFSNLSATVTSNGLSVSFTETGLTAGSVHNYSVSADASAVWGCFNKSGRVPAASNKRATVNSEVEGDGRYTANASGVVTGRINLGMPSLGGRLSCPTGQTPMISSVRFTNVRITNTGTNASANVTGTFSKVVRPMKNGS